MAQTTQSYPAQPATAVPEEVAGFTVLVVDDDQHTRELVRRLLASQGHTVLQAANGRQAMERFLEASPELVVCDVRMPDMDGIELLGKIRELSAVTEVVMITGFADAELVIEALRKGASNFVEKPFRLEELLAQLERSFAQCRLRRETAQLQSQLDQERRRRELDARMATMGRLVAGLAHEIQNPVTFLKGNAELVRLLLQRHWGEAGEASRQEVDTLLADLEFGAQRIGDLVEVMRSYAAPRQAQPAVVQLSRLVEESRKLAEHRRPPGVQLVVHPRGLEVFVRVHPVEWESCLVNLLVNAYEVLGEGGAVAVRAALLPYPTCAYAGIAELVVEDNGPGIPQGILDEVFTPFFTRKQGGTGLGLSIAFEAARRSGTQMQIDSREEAGTRVTLRLPYCTEPVGTAGETGVVRDATDVPHSAGGTQCSK